MEERLYWLGFSVFPGIGPTKFKHLLNNFGSAKDAWLANESELKNILGDVLSVKFKDFRKRFSVENYFKLMERKEVFFLCWDQDEYPTLLKKIPNPPFVLYIKNKNSLRSLRQFENFSDASVPPSRLIGGTRDTVASNKKFSHAKAPREFKNANRKNLISSPRQSDSRHPFRAPRGIFNDQVIAVVGTRKITQYGKEVTEFLTQDLVNAGFTIVSGLAFGVDSASHKTAVENYGKTIAVLGCGVDCCTPPSNQALYNSIVASGGCIVSELPLGQPPSRGSFPSRNRIIAGLSQAVLVTEGAQDSGALITADYALKFGRKVFAVPGPITSSLSKGPYKLISKGAKLVTTAEDILKEFKVHPPAGGSKFKIKTQNSKLQNGTKEEKEIMRILQNEPLSFDQILRETKLSSAKLGSILSIMEVKGIIKSSQDGMFSI